MISYTFIKHLGSVLNYIRMGMERYLCDLRNRMRFRLFDVGIRNGMFGFCLRLNVGPILNSEFYETILVRRKFIVDSFIIEIHMSGGQKKMKLSGVIGQSEMCCI